MKLGNIQGIKFLDKISILFSVEEASQFQENALPRKTESHFFFIGKISL